MPAIVRVPTVLQKLAAGKDQIPATGRTVGEVLDALRGTHSGLVQRITSEEGQIKPFLNVFVNGADIRFEKNLDTAVDDGDEISIVPSIAGG